VLVIVESRLATWFLFVLSQGSLASLEGTRIQERYFDVLLYRKLYHCPELLEPEFEPLLFDQSQFDYGKVWLRPRVSLFAALNVAMPHSGTALDLRLHLSLTKKELMDENRVGLAMNRLARALQYLPEMHLIDFLELNAGDAEVRMFLIASRRLTIVKKK
jgi:hypothetical protein